MYNLRDHHHGHTSIQDREAKATGPSSKKRRTIPLKGGGLLLPEPGVVSLPACLREHKNECVCFVQSWDVSVCEVSVSPRIGLPVFVYRQG